jgi:hypothetical protein
MSKGALEHQVIAYPHPKYHKMIVALAGDEIISKSSATSRVLKEYFDSLPKDKQEKLLKFYDTMTPAQRKNPGKQSLW